MSDERKVIPPKPLSKCLSLDEWEARLKGTPFYEQMQNRGARLRLVRPYEAPTAENVEAATLCIECLGSGYEDPWAPDGKLRVCAACHGKGR